MIDAVSERKASRLDGWKNTGGGDGREGEELRKMGYTRGKSEIATRVAIL